jgi:hypothetical protein
MPRILSIVFGCVFGLEILFLATAPSASQQTTLISKYTKIEYVIFVGRRPVCKNLSDASALGGDRTYARYGGSAAYTWAMEFEDATEEQASLRGAEAARMAADFDRKYGRCRFVQNGQPDFTGTSYIRNEYAIDGSDPKSKSHVQVNDSLAAADHVIVPVIFPEGVYYAVVAPGDILSWTDHPTLDTPEGNPLVAVIRTRCEPDAWKNGTCIQRAVMPGQIGRRNYKKIFKFMPDNDAF